MVGAYDVHKEMATTFVDWLVKEDGGQKVIKDFPVNGEVFIQSRRPVLILSHESGTFCSFGELGERQTLFNITRSFYLCV